MKQSRPINQQLKKRRKFLLIAPLLILPFVTLAFWALGGGASGGGEGRGNKEQKNVSGINAEIPRANVSLRPKDKMSIYMESDRAAEGREEALVRYGGPVAMNSITRGARSDSRQGEDVNAVKIEQKLADLQKVLDASTAAKQTRYAPGLAVHPAGHGLRRGRESEHENEEEIGEDNGKQLERLHQLSELIAGKAGGEVNRDAGASGGPDGDMQQINTMLDKILAIQHPEKTAVKLQEMSRSHAGNVYGVQVPRDDVKVPLLTPPSGPDRERARSGKTYPGEANLGDSAMSFTGNDGARDSALMFPADGRPLTGAFFDIDGGKSGVSKWPQTVRAVIAEEQTLVSGAAVKLRLTGDVFIHGVRIPKGQFVYGTGTVNGERLTVSVKHIRFRNRIFPVALSVFDLDGMEGIRIPGAIGRKASKEGADRALQSVQMMSLNPGLSAQMAGAGMEAVKGLLSKKVRLVRVTVKAGYPVLLMDEKRQQK